VTCRADPKALLLAPRPVSTIIITSQYFLLRRGAANGVVYAGGALGGVTLSLSFEQLIQKVGLPWTFRIYGFAIFLIGYPAAWHLVERPVRQAKHLVDLTLFRDHRFLLLVAGAVIGCFPLFVPAFFLPSYATTIGLSSGQGAGLVAGYNVASLVGRLSFGASSDRFGPLNCLITTLVINAVSFLAIWPVASPNTIIRLARSLLTPPFPLPFPQRTRQVSTTITPLVFFIVLNGAANVSPSLSPGFRLPN
jgi:nitrate/nitrite transporter NarK